MKKLLFLFIFVINCAFAGDVPFKIFENGKRDIGIQGLKIMSTTEKKLTVDHTKIKINKGKCQLFDPNLYTDEAAKYLRENPPTNMLMAMATGEQMQREIIKKIPDKRISTVEYGEYIYIATMPDCYDIIEIEVPTNLGKFVVKF